MVYRIFAVCALFGLAACNTVDGAGQDLNAAGSAISQEARQAQ